MAQVLSCYLHLHNISLHYKLCACSVDLRRDPQKGDGRTEAGHQGERHRERTHRPQHARYDYQSKEIIKLFTLRPTRTLLYFSVPSTNSTPLMRKTVTMNDILFLGSKEGESHNIVVNHAYVHFDFMNSFEYTLI